MIQTVVSEPTVPPAVAMAAPAQPIALGEVNKYVGQLVTVCGKIYDSKLLKNIVNKPTLMNMGGSFASERLEVRINFNSLAKFDYNPEKLFVNKNLCLTGTISNEHGFIEIAMDSMQANQFLNEAKLVKAEPVKLTGAKKIKLVKKAYLFAGPDLNEPIITHLKAGSLIIAQYTAKGWTYATIIQKAEKANQEEYLAGFIRNWALR